MRDTEATKAESCGLPWYPTVAGGAGSCVRNAGHKGPCGGGKAGWVWVDDRDAYDANPWRRAAVVETGEEPK